VRYALRDSDPQLANKPIEDRARFATNGIVKWLSGLMF
jgi:hypothetical protein